MTRRKKRKTVAPRRTTPYYVTMTDSFMSDWGKAKGKVNKLVLPCKDYREAQIVARNAKDRPEMKHVSIRRSKPHYDPRRVKMSVASKKSYKRWYKTTRPFLDRGYKLR